MSGSSLLAQKPFVLEYLGAAEGFPSLNVKAIAQDRQGLMWFACYDDGLIRYDGARVKIFSHIISSSPRLGGGRIRDILLDPNGLLWIAHESGIDVLNPKTLQLVKQIAFNTDTPNEKAEARSLCLDRSGDVWACVYAGGIFRFHSSNPDQMECVKRLKNADYVNLSVDGTLRAIGHPDSNFVWMQGRFIPAKYPRACAPNQVETIRVIENEDGLFSGFRLMLHDDQSECFKIDLKTGEFLAGLPADGITPLTHPEIAHRVRENAGRLSKAPLFNHPFKVFKDNKGLIWVAPGYGGVFKLKPSVIQFSICPDLYDVSLRGMLEDHSGSVYIASYNGFFKYNTKTNRAERISHKEKQIFYHIGALESGVLTVFSEYNGFGRYLISKDVYVPALYPGIKLDNAYFSSLSLKNGWLLAGNQNIFRLRLSDFRLQKWATLPAFPELHTYCFTLARNGNIWLGTTQGVFVLHPDGQTETPAIRKDPRLSNSSQINDIYEDAAGNLWFATRNYGLLHYYPATDKIEAFDTDSGFSSNETYKIAGSHHDSILWVSTFAGMQCIHLVNRKIYLFQEEDGASGSEFNTGSFLNLHNGDFLFGGAKGLTRFNPNLFNPFDTAAYQPFVADIMVEDVYSAVFKTINYPPSDTFIQFSTSQNTLEFNFGSNNYFHTKANTFYVQLEGVDPDWTPLNSATSIKYHRLPPGPYTFKVKLGLKGNEMTYVYRIHFQIEKVMYKKWWFILIVALIGAALLYLAFQTRRQRYIREENIRRDIAYELHHALGGKISTISNLIHILKKQTAEKKPIQTELQHLEDIVQRAHSTLSDVIWVLAQKQESGTGLVSRMNDYLDKWIKPLQIAVSFEQNIEQQERHIPLSAQHLILIIFKEMLGNVIKHTFSHAISIRFIQSPDNAISLSVTNDFFEKKSNVPSSGQGLKIIRRQVEQMGGTVQVQSEKNRFAIAIHLNKL